MANQKIGFNMLKYVYLVLMALLLSACGNSSDSLSEGDNNGADAPAEDVAAPDIDDDLPAEEDSEPALVWNQGAFNKTFWQ